ncbi:SMI1/KNR4 family protein [Streptomyces liangshanensis]|uniref:Knr4/Smi1-like domain-containing protein n=1 Tax=Streptomyces liangshanensis TaxID=2717324 RepID=A0A6G9GX51_9ACTN|nr:SMI1/KNR4 family protein [Streptomyces liangshanensis]QIQ02629.1 hypothetical protein HA039_10140 [Streptomyces liangshanensis]
MSSTIEAWSRVTRWMNENTPDHADALNDPATDEQIAQAEEKMGVRLPVELKQLLKVNNGSTAKQRSIAGNERYDIRGGGDYSPFPFDYAFCDVELICSLYTTNRKASIDLQEPGSRYEYWKEGWIPVFRTKEEHSGLFLDVSGLSGQDPAPVYEYGEESFPDLAFPSLADYLSTMADALEGIRPFTIMGRRSPNFPVVQEGLIHW